MPSRDEFAVALSELREYVEGIGDRVVEERVEGLLTAAAFGEQQSLVGHRCESAAGATYVVAGHPDRRYFVVGYVLSLRHNLADEMTERAAREVLESRGIDGVDSPERRAVDVLLGELSDEEVDALTSYLYLLLASPAADVDFHFTEEGVLDLYTVGRQIHPYEDGFGLQDFYEAVSSVRIVGERGSRLVGRTVWLDTEGASSEEYAVRLHFDW